MRWHPRRRELGGAVPFDSQANRHEVTVDAALLVLRLVPGLLLIGHGMQKLLPPSYAPPVLHAAMGVRATASAFEGLGVRPGPPSAIFAATAEVCGGFSLAAGLLTPVGTALVVG
jgi:putative oxidoreductase